MIHVLDTDTLIHMIRGLKTAGRRSAQRERALQLVDKCRQAQKDGHRVGVSAVSVSELEFGARRGGRYEDEIEAVRKILAPFETYDYDAVTCPVHYGRIRHELERAGLSIGAMDLLIAAHALSLGGTVVTNNIEHFRRVPGLSVADWR
ncbi:MAG: type II toxin-antitoxin system VapC family toxin [Candidatus Riflebacteria bacterium]|nr:type II toxin-antitoxin system VapC family toxin [Candidatus Riflebacteria bacterium]